MRTLAPHHAERVVRIELRQRMVRQDDVRDEMLERIAQGRFALDAPTAARDPGARERPDHQLGIVLDVFHQQDPERLSGEG